MSSSPIQCLKCGGTVVSIAWFYSRQMQFCVTGSEDRGLSWVPVLLLTLWLFATPSIQILVRNVLHYVPVLLPSHHLQVHKIFHYVPLTPPPPPTNSPSSGHLRNQQRPIKYIIWVSGTYKTFWQTLLTLDTISFLPLPTPSFPLSILYIMYANYFFYERGFKLKVTEL